MTDFKGISTRKILKFGLDLAKGLVLFVWLLWCFNQTFFVLAENGLLNLGLEFGYYLGPVMLSFAGSGAAVLFVAFSRLKHKSRRSQLITTFGIPLAVTLVLVMSGNICRLLGLCEPG